MTTRVRTKLCRVSGINQYHSSPSFFRFGGCVLYELIPGYIGHALVDGLLAVGLHPNNVQIFKHNDLALLNQFPAFFVGKVPAPVGNALMNMVQGTDCLAPFRTSLRQAGDFALDALQVLFVSPEPSLPLDFPPIGELPKGGQAQVDTDNFVCGRQGLWFNDAGKTGIPVPQPVTPDSQGFYLFINRAMKFDPDITDLRKSQSGVIAKRKPGLFEGEAIVSARPFETGESRRLTGFHPPKEGFESQVNALLNILQHLRVNSLEFRPVCLPEGEHPIGVVEAGSLSPGFIKLLALLKRFVVRPPAVLKGVIQFCSLCLCGKQSILERFTHISPCANCT